MAQYPIDYPATMGNGYWFKKMSGTVITRTSDNSTDATETNMDSCLIPAGIVQPNSIIKIWCLMGFSNNSATGTTKNIRLAIDADPLSNPVSGATAIITSAQTTNIGAVFTSQLWFNGSVASSYNYNGNAGIGGATGTNAPLNRTVDFSVDRNIVFNVSWAINQAVSQTFTLNGWVVEVLR